MSDIRETQIIPAVGDTAFNEIWRRLDNLEKLVFLGNGQPSIMQQVAEIKRGLQTQTWLLRTVLGVVFSNLVALIFLAVKLVLARGA